MTDMQHVEAATTIVRAAGGRIVGRTKFQKIGYLLTATGLVEGFPFEYKHYGPYSEELAQSVKIASFISDVRIAEQPTQWGGTYSIITADNPENADTPRTRLARLAANADAVNLELAATAVYLRSDGFDHPWNETARRKPEKAANGRLDAAKELYEQLRAIDTPVPLPVLL